ncbi:MAG: AMP-binding protein, partial [Mycobacterium leprae]
MPASARNLAELVRDSPAWRPERAALVADARRFTWGRLDRAVDAFAAALAGARLPTGARVALVLGNVPEFAVAYFGVLRAGLVAVPVSPAYTSRELTHVLADAEAALVVCRADASAAVRAAARATRARVVVVGAEPA